MKKFLLSLILAVSLVSSSWAGVLFDNVDDIMSNESFADIGGVSSGCAWIKPVSTGEGTFGRIFHASTSDDVTDVAMEMSPTNAFGFFVGWSGPDGEWDSNNNTAILNAWNHYCYTYSAVAGVAPLIYINGSSVNVNSIGGTTSGTPNVTDEIDVGNRESAARTFDGTIGDLAIWSVVLTASEISVLYTSNVKHMPLQIQESNLVAYWALDDEEDGSSADADTFIDLSGNGYTLTGADGANNTGLTSKAEAVLSYP